jgi:hypothetical protein
MGGFGLGLAFWKDRWAIKGRICSAVKEYVCMLAINWSLIKVACPIYALKGEFVKIGELTNPSEKLSYPAAACLAPHSSLACEAIYLTTCNLQYSNFLSTQRHYFSPKPPKCRSQSE